MATVGDLSATNLAYRANLDGGISFNNPTTGDGRLVLPIWAGEVIHAYDQYNIFEPMVESRTISSGTTMEFPVTGYVNLNPQWQAGEELVGDNDSAATTFRVTLDKRPIATHFELDNIDLMLTQWEYRSELARQAGRTLSDARDRQIGLYIARAAAEDGLANDPRELDNRFDRTSTTAEGFSAIGGLGGKVFCNKLFDDLGNSSSSASARTNAALKLLEKIEEFQIRLQEVDAPTEGVFCAVEPRTFQDIRALGVARDSSDLAGGAGRPFFGGVADAGGLGAGLAQGMFNLADRLEYQGCTIIKTNHLPNKNYNLHTIGEARYNRTCNVCPVKALIWQQGCVASLKMMGLKVDQVDDVRRNTVFTVASMMGGTGVMKPEHAAVCIGRPAADLRTGGSYQGETDGKAVFKGSCTGGLGADQKVGFLEFNSTTNDLDGYEIDPEGDSATVDKDIAGAATQSAADALVRDMYQLSLGVTHADYDGDGDVDDSGSDAGFGGGAEAATSAMVLEYTKAGDISVFGTLGGADGLGTAAD